MFARRLDVDGGLQLDLVLNMAVAAVVLGAFVSAVLLAAFTHLWVVNTSGQAGVLDLIGHVIAIPFTMVFGLVILGLPTLALTLPSAVVWAVIVRRVNSRP